jgi:NAD(P)-dependent dehydrogenase (short-subunit alcohol dehydrogenase family)
MSDQGAVIVVGSTRGIGLEIVRHFAGRGDHVILTGRTQAAADEAARAVGGNVTGIALELSRPKTIAASLADVGPVRALVLAAIDRDQNTIADYDIDRAITLATLKLVGYAEVIHVLRPRMTGETSIVLFGGIAMYRPYPGSTTVSTVNGGIIGMARSLVSELKPIRVNVLHPGIVGDSPYWSDKKAALDATLARTPTGRLVAMEDIVGAVAFLVDNRSVNGIELLVDGGIYSV